MRRPAQSSGPAGPGDAAEKALTPHILKVIAHAPSAYRLSIFGVLHGSDGPMVGAVVRVLAAALLNVAIDVEVLDACGARSLWDMTRAEGEAQHGMLCRAPVAADRARQNSRDLAGM